MTAPFRNRVEMGTKARRKLSYPIWAGGILRIGQCSSSPVFGPMTFQCTHGQAMAESTTGKCVPIAIEIFDPALIIPRESRAQRGPPPMAGEFGEAWRWSAPRRYSQSSSGERQNESRAGGHKCRVHKRVLGEVAVGPLITFGIGDRLSSDSSSSNEIPDAS